MAGYLIDANLPRWFSLWADGNCQFVHDLDPAWSDSEIWRYAEERGLTIVTKDADFSDRVLISTAGQASFTSGSGISRSPIYTGVFPTFGPRSAAPAGHAGLFKFIAIGSRRSNKP